MLAVVLWWILIQLLGLLALPVAYSALRWLPDRGFSFAKSIGLLLTTYFLWLGGSTGLLYNNLGGISASVLILVGISAWLFLRRPGLTRSLTDFLRQEKRYILFVEALFLAAFLFWVTLRAHTTFPRIASAGGEKFMEMAFLNGSLNSLTFPPLDPWLSGFGISYYYFGYLMMAFMTRLSGISVDVAFDLYDALVFALAVLGAFGVVYNLIAGSQKAENRFGAVWYGTLGAVLVVFMGNLNGLLESLQTRGLLSERVIQWLDVPSLGESPVTGSWVPSNPPGWVWWWHGSRVIQDYDLSNNPVGASPINEFPFFSFLLGDNHPHKLALPFVLLAAGLALNLLRRQLSNLLQPDDLPSHRWWNPIRYTLEGDRGLFLFYAVALGSLGFLNTWDMPIYIALVSISYFAGTYLLAHRLNWEILQRTLVLSLSLLLGSALFYIFFYLSFSSQAGGILPYVFPPTRLAQYFVMFGSFVLIMLPFLVAAFLAAPEGEEKHSKWTQAGITWIKVTSLFIGGYLLLLAIAAAAVKLPELFGRSDLAPSIGGFLSGMSLSEAMTAIIQARLQNPWLFLLLTFLITLALLNFLKFSQAPGKDMAVEAADSPISGIIFAVVMILFGLLLTFSTEFVYLRDMFGTRMNTVFKFYFQGWILFSLGSAYALWWMLNPGRAVLGTAGRSLYASLVLVAIGAGLVYSFFGYAARSGNLEGQALLNGSIEIARGNPDDWAAIEWLRNLNTAGEGVPVILEAPAERGAAYRYEGRISAFTGYPSLLGWSGHENQWRGSYEEQAKREEIIATIYTTGNAAQAVDLLHDWNVQYVVVGGPEVGYITGKCNEPGRSCTLSRALSKFDTSFEPAFQSGQVTIYRVP